MGLNRGRGKRGLFSRVLNPGGGNNGSFSDCGSMEESNGFECAHSMWVSSIRYVAWYGVNSLGRHFVQKKPFCRFDRGGRASLSSGTKQDRSPRSRSAGFSGTCWSTGTCGAAGTGRTTRIYRTPGIYWTAGACRNPGTRRTTGIGSLFLSLRNANAGRCRREPHPRHQKMLSANLLPPR
jgi:hypothetical protein